jgi:hypothetical protein
MDSVTLALQLLLDHCVILMLANKILIVQVTLVLEESVFHVQVMDLSVTQQLALKIMNVLQEHALTRNVPLVTTMQILAQTCSVMVILAKLMPIVYQDHVLMDNAQCVALKLDQFVTTNNAH